MAFVIYAVKVVVIASALFVKILSLNVEGSETATPRGRIWTATILHRTALVIKHRLSIPWRVLRRLAQQIDVLGNMVGPVHHPTRCQMRLVLPFVIDLGLSVIRNIKKFDLMHRNT